MWTAAQEKYASAFDPYNDPLGRYVNLALGAGLHFMSGMERVGSQFSGSADYVGQALQAISGNRIPATYFGDLGMTVASLTVGQPEYIFAAKAAGMGVAPSVGRGALSYAAETAALDANAVRFSQGTVSFTKVRPGGTYTYDDIVQSMSANGWKGDAVDVVKMSDGNFTTIDNTRVLAGREAGINVQAKVRAFDEQLPANLLEQRRFGDA